jgi:histone-lysine N-methyltransferase SETMAR
MENLWILNYDKAPAHNALSVKQYLANKNIIVVQHPPYSADLAPCGFYFFLKNQVSAQRNPFYVGRKCESKNGGEPQ